MSVYSTRYFCTYFDSNYLSRALALHASLRRVCPDFRLFALCHDEKSFSHLKQLNLDDFVPIQSSEFEKEDSALQAARSNRAAIEYYFTCTPSFCLYVFNRFPEVDLLTYLDADLFFFSSPQHIFTEMGDASIAIIEHRFSLLARHLEKYGRYNVGWLSFRRDTTGIACLTRWRNQCLEWCGDYLGSDRFADQKYLDDWTTVFSNVRVIRNIGANVAPWNIANYRVASSNGAVSVSGKPLVFFHFASLKEIRPWLYRMNMAGYYTFASKHIRQNIYAPYVRELKHFGMVGTIRNRAPGKKLLISSLPKRLKIMARDARSLIFFDYLVFFKNRFF